MRNSISLRGWTVISIASVKPSLREGFLEGSMWIMVPLSAQHLAQITASLGIALIHSTPYQPEGRGKCERWFRTVREQFLSRWQKEDLGELNQAFLRWLQDSYHVRAHAVTGQTPIERFSSHLECLRPAPALLGRFLSQTGSSDRSQRPNRGLK